ncbi:MAG: sugar ABC transporter permease [Dehalococcoidales bacterium]|nr:sugar ABC transporter permease [Dehalococcoidales bacterium]
MDSQAGREGQAGARETVSQFIDRHIMLLLFLPAFLVLFLVTVVPFLTALWFSFTGYNLAKPNSDTFVGLETYQIVLSDPATRNALFNTFYLVAACVATETVLGVGLALLLARQFRGVRVVRSLFLVPLMTTPVVVALTWRMLYNTRFGYVNYFLGLLGLPTQDWLGDPALAMWALVVADIWVATPFVATIVLAGLLSLPEEPFEAAVVDGASALQTFWRITLPMLRPVLALAIMFRAVDAFVKFESILIMTGGGPGEVTTTLNFLAFNTGFYFLRLADAAVMSVVMVFLMLTIAFASIRWLGAGRV